MSPSPGAATSFDLTGRTALVTGATRGLGKAIAAALAGAGADLVIVSRSAQACGEVAAELAATSGRRVLGRACHVGRWAEIDKLVEDSYDHFGSLDILVNNAGMSPLYESLDSLSEELFDKVVAVNWKGPFRLTALIGARMAAAAGGSIINISSIAAIRPDPKFLPYAAAKAALDAATVGFARAFGPKVRVNSVMAGPFLTSATSGWGAAQVRDVERVTALKRMGRPEEITGAVLYLASDLSSFTTGSVLRVDGGRH